MIKNLELDTTEFEFLLDGGTPHGIYKSPVAYKVGDRIKVIEAANEGAKKRTANAKVVAVTTPGHHSLPPDVGVVSIALLAPKIGSRLFRTLRGHHMELQAAFVRSAAHKLPGSKGRLRERAVARFLNSWMPRRYQPFTNVFFSHPDAGLFKNEVDLALYDVHEGTHWALDGSQENWMLDWEYVKVIFEIKSTLDEDTWNNAVNEIRPVVEYACAASGDRKPLTVLFAYKVSPEFLDHFEELLSKDHEFDAIILLEGGAYLAKRRSTTAHAFVHRLTPEEASRDQRVSAAMVIDDISMNTEGYLKTTKSPEETLMALIYICTEECAGSKKTLSLLSALGVVGTAEPLGDANEFDLEGPTEGQSELAHDIAAEFNELHDFFERKRDETGTAR